MSISASAEGRNFRRLENKGRW